MTPEELQTKARAALELQRELEDVEDRFARAIKELMAVEHETKRTLIVSVDGEIWRLDRWNHTTEAMETAKRYGGFYNQFRFHNLGKPV